MVVVKLRGVILNGTTADADLGGSSNHSNVTFED